MVSESDQVDLYIVGLGIGGLERLTCETEAVIRGAHEVLCISSRVRELGRLCEHGRVTSLWSLYNSSDDPPTTYAAISEQVVAAAHTAHDAGGYACFATPGHPMWLVRATRTAAHVCRQHDLRVVVCPAVSSFDTILIDAPVDFDAGVQLLEATRFVRDRLEVDRRLPLMLFQFGDYGSAKLRPARDDVQRYTPIIDRLTELYGSDHVVHMVLSGWGSGMAAEVHSSTVGRLWEHLSHARVGTTLVVPAAPMGNGARSSPPTARP